MTFFFPRECWCPLFSLYSALCMIFKVLEMSALLLFWIAMLYSRYICKFHQNTSTHAVKTAKKYKYSLKTATKIKVFKLFLCVYNEDTIYYGNVLFQMSFFKMFHKKNLLFDTIKENKREYAYNQCVTSIFFCFIFYFFSVQQVN